MAKRTSKKGGRILVLAGLGVFGWGLWQVANGRNPLAQLADAYQAFADRNAAAFDAQRAGDFTDDLTAYSGWDTVGGLVDGGRAIIEAPSTRGTGTLGGLRAGAGITAAERAQVAAYECDRAIGLGLIPANLRDACTAGLAQSHSWRPTQAQLPGRLVPTITIGSAGLPGGAVVPRAR